MTVLEGKKRPENAPLTREEEEALWREWDLTKSPEVRQRFVSSVLGLAVNEAKRCSLGCAEIDDLIQAGMTGACIAFDKFDPSHGTRFNTYAMFWIRAEIWALVKNERNLISGTGLTGRKSDNDKQVLISYMAGGDGLGSLGEDERGIVSRLVDSLHGSGNSSAPAEKLLTRPNAQERLEDNDEKELLKLAIADANLMPNEAKIIQMRYLDDHALEMPTAAAVARVLGLSRERIRQIEQRALRKIRRAARRQGAELELDRYGDFQKAHAEFEGES